MSTVVPKLLLLNRAILTRNTANTIRRSFNAQNVAKNSNNKIWIIGVGGCVGALGYAHWFKSHNVKASSNLKNLKKTSDSQETQRWWWWVKQSSEERSVRLTSRERRFIKFSSVEFDAQLYMTPQDFLDSMVEQEPRPRLKRRLLTPTEVKQIYETTPALKKGSPRMFRNMRDKGLISYTEYLFLLSILTKPQSGFRIAFNMFDTDGNRRVDKNEFLVIRKILAGSFSQHDMDETTRSILLHLVSTDEQASNLKIKHKRHDKAAVDAVEEQVSLERKHAVVTTLQTHFFGAKGDKVLNYDGFHKFMDNLQREVLEMEFNEFSKGHIAITEVDFAKILLRYTYLNTDEYDAFLERLLDRVKDERGITFEEFLDFCRFLNNLDDFAIAMRMYNLADHAISKDEFSRAVKICTGYTLSAHLLNTVFALFDRDGDGRLSHEEFIAIMRDRVHRGFKSTPKNEGWEAFKMCVKNDSLAAY